MALCNFELISLQRLPVGHHPIDEVDVVDMTSLIQAHGFAIYLNGHAHALTHYTLDKAGVYVTSGAGKIATAA